METTLTRYTGSTSQFLAEIDFGKSYCVKMRTPNGTEHFITGTGPYVCGAILLCDTILAAMEF